MKQQLISLDILNKLVSSLKEALSNAEDIRNSKEGLVSDYVVEMSKFAGIAAGLVNESQMLFNDAQLLIKNFSTPPKSPGPDLGILDKIASNLKGNGKPN